jgi:hypothetical protein
MTSMVGPLGGAVSESDSGCHRVLKTRSMAGPLGALPAVLVASAIEFEDNVDGRPPGRFYQWVRQRLSLSFEDDVDGGHLGSVVGGSGRVPH